MLCVDITDLSDPQVLSDAIRTRGLVGEMCYANSTLYPATGPGGLEIWDVSDPSNPGLLGRYFTSDRTWDVEVRDTIACIADWEGGLRMLSVADPANVYQVGWYDSPGAAYTMAIFRDTIVFLTDWDEGTQVVNVADPTDPFAIANIPYGVGNWGIDIEGELAYITDFLGGLYIYDITDPSNAVFRGGYETWDATDRASTLAPGVFFYRLETDQARATRKAVVIR